MVITLLNEPMRASSRRKQPFSMAADRSKKVSIGWWVGLGQYYIAHWRLKLFGCLVLIVAALAIWLDGSAPFAVGSSVTSGEVTSVSCGSKSYSYTYSYSVHGALYSGESGWGGSDGNPGSCATGRIGQPVLVTFDQTHPDRSLGGTIEGRFISCAQILGFTVVFMALFGIPISYVKERWRQRAGEAQAIPASASRQHRRALERRERKANRIH